MNVTASERATRRAQARILTVALVFLAIMGAATARLGAFASDDGAPARRIASGAIETASIRIERAEIVDRRGASLAASAPTYALYLDRAFLALPEERAEAAAQLSRLFPEDAERLTRLLGERSDDTITVRFRATPLEAREALDLGIAGLYRTERTDRVYLGGRAASHVIGYVNAAGVGVAGVEGGLDREIRAPGAGPVRLSLDLRVQVRVWEILSDAMSRYGALAAAAVVMDVRTGEVVAIVSLPDFDPHRAINQPFAEGPADPRFFWAMSTGYEPGSTLKTVAWALALETGVADMSTLFDLPRSIRVGPVQIRDHEPFGPISFPDAFARSSNVVAATLALEAGEESQRALFAGLGLMERSSLEVLEARAATPVWHRDWRDYSTATTAFGHGVQLSPVHLAEMMATLVGGGERVRATLLADPAMPLYRERVVSEETSAGVRALLSLAVSSGTGRLAAVDGLDVGGKTGTAEKVGRGGYLDNRNIANFIAAFPMRDPQYVVVVMLDEPVATLSDGRTSRYASRTAAPTAGEIIAAIAPLLGVSARSEAE